LFAVNINDYLVEATINLFKPKPPYPPKEGLQNPKVFIFRMNNERSEYSDSRNPPLEGREAWFK